MIAMAQNRASHDFRDCAERCDVLAVEMDSLNFLRAGHALRQAAVCWRRLADLDEQLMVLQGNDVDDRVLRPMRGGY